VVFWGKPTVNAEDFLINNRSDGQTVETVSEGLPQLDVVPPFAFIVESVDTVDGRTFVISAQQEKILGILDFVRQQQANRFQALFPSIHIVSQKQIVGVRREASVFEQSKQVIVLSVYVADYL
jgi:hypothetical protein